MPQVLKSCVHVEEQSNTGDKSWFAPVKPTGFPETQCIINWQICDVNIYCIMSLERNLSSPSLISPKRLEDVCFQ